MYFNIQCVYRNSSLICDLSLPSRSGPSSRGNAVDVSLSALTARERTWSRADFLGLAVRNGRRSTGAPGTGELVPGHPADFVVLDLDGLDRDAIMPVDPLDMLFARGNAQFLR